MEKGNTATPVEKISCTYENAKKSNIAVSDICNSCREWPGKKTPGLDSKMNQFVSSLMAKMTNDEKFASYEPGNF